MEPGVEWGTVPAAWVQSQLENSGSVNSGAPEGSRWPDEVSQMSSGFLLS